ncbi:MAG: hypothetical protein RLZZ230_330 [Candidatus Parcubacteria bacterium]
MIGKTIVISFVLSLGKIVSEGAAHEVHARNIFNYELTNAEVRRFIFVPCLQLEFDPSSG